MKMVMFGSCMGCIYHKAFGYMIMLLQSADLYIYGVVGWERSVLVSLHYCF